MVVSLGVSLERLRSMVDKVGNSAATVRKELDREKSLMRSSEALWYIADLGLAVCFAVLAVSLLQAVVGLVS
jgi:hypothetical protein